MSVTINEATINQQTILSLLDNLPPEKLTIVSQIIQRLSEQLKTSDNAIKAVEIELMNGHYELLWQSSTEEQLPRTKLGVELLKHRADIISSGEPLLDWSEIEVEVKTQRGEQV